MATKSPLRLATLSLRPSRRQTPITTTKRTFLASLLANNDKPIHINVSRTLPYPRAQLYELIADVDSYSQFLKYCKHSRVTEWTTTPAPPTGAADQAAAAAAAASTGSSSSSSSPTRKKWPSAGELSLGWGPVEQTYTSRIVCVPGVSVEAHSGLDEPVCREADERRGSGSSSNPFRKLSTRWALRGDDDPGHHHQNNSRVKSTTIVDLSISMTLQDPSVHVMLSYMVDDVAKDMIQAFERRAEALFGPAAAQK